MKERKKEGKKERETNMKTYPVLVYFVVVRKIARRNEQLKKFTLYAALEHGIGYKLNNIVLANAGRAMKRHDQSFFGPV